MTFNGDSDTLRIQAVLETSFASGIARQIIPLYVGDDAPTAAKHILSFSIDNATGCQLYHDFARDFLFAWPTADFSITQEEIQLWVGIQDARSEGLYEDSQPIPKGGEACPS